MLCHVSPATIQYLHQYKVIRKIPSLGGALDDLIADKKMAEILTKERKETLS